MSYRIEDEPQPSGLSQVAVNPVWPLLSVMFGGAYLSWPWFALNGFALGSPHRRQELGWAIGGFLGSAVIVFVVVSLADGNILQGVGIQYALIVLTVWKLAVSYWLYTLQNRSFGLYQYFGGTVRNGVVVIFLAFFLAPRVLQELPTLLVLVLR